MPFSALLGLQHASWKESSKLYKHFRIAYKSPVVTSDQLLLHLNSCFYLHAGLVLSLSWGLETVLGSPRNQQERVSLTDKLIAAKSRQGLYLITDSCFTQRCDLGFLQLVLGNILYKMSQGLAIMHDSLGRDAFKGKLDSRSCWNTF